MFSNAEVIVTQIVMTQYIVESLFISNQSMTNLPKLTNLPTFMIKFQKKKLSQRNLARRFLRLLKITAPVLNIDYIHAVVEAINCLVFK